MENIYSNITSLLTSNQRKSAVILLILMVVGMFLELLGVGLVLPIIAMLVQQDYSANHPWFKNLLEAAGNPSDEMVIVGAMLTLVCVYLLKNFFLAFLIWSQTRFIAGLQAGLSQRLFTLYLRQPYTFHLQRNSAQLIRNVQGEVSILSGSVAMPVILFLAEMMVLVGICTLMFIIEPLGTFIVLVVLGMAAWSFQYVTKKHVTRWGKERQYHEGMRIQHLHQGLGGAKDVKLLGREDEFLNQYGLHTLKGARINQLQSALQQMPRLWLELLGILGLTALVFSMLLQGKEISSILPTLGLFAAAAFRLMPSVNRIIGAIQQLRFGLPVVETLNKELKLEQTGKSEKLANGEKTFNKQIRLDNICYSYPNSPIPALEHISLVINKGESIGFIGPSGSGKSTLVDLILGLLTPDSGHVVVDGVDIQLSIRDWQDKIGYVPQSIYLTDDTLRRNVAFGLSDKQIDIDAVSRAIKAAQLEEFVNSLPEGFETIVGERGVRLSGGQRQRIGIARALYHDPAILVLDEATSALDTTTENSVMQTINTLHGAKTIIIVAHRMSTVEKCDRLYYLKKGCLDEMGITEDVLSTNNSTSLS